MAENLDIQMNQLPTATDVDYIYAEAADGSQVKIAKADIINLIRNSLTVTFSSWAELDAYVNSMPSNSVVQFSSLQFAFRDTTGFLGNYQGGFIVKFNATLTVVLSLSHSNFINLRIKNNDTWANVVPWTFGS